MTVFQIRQFLNLRDDEHSQLVYTDNLVQNDMIHLEALAEKRTHIIRWILLSGWLILLVLIIVPKGGIYRPVICNDLSICNDSISNDIFWNIILPLVLLCIVFSHAFWRRICPLSFVSQLARAVGRQRCRTGASGKKRLVFVEERSWLGKHHIQLQWSLLIAGLCIRILVANSSGIVLAVMCSAAIIGALVTGWSYAGKAWCQYFCPLGVVQQVITGPRSLPGRDAHINQLSRTTQSMCRTSSGEQGQTDNSACVACIKPCMDIDAERQYWTNLQGKRGLNWAWYSYPGLVISFFLLIESYAPKGVRFEGLNYLKSHLYTYDNRLTTLAWDSITPSGWIYTPRLIAIPLVITLSAIISQQLFSQLELWQQRRLGRLAQHQSGVGIARNIAIHRTRLISTVIAVNSYFLFKGSPFPIKGDRDDAVFKLLVMAVMAMWLYRGWHRDQSLYERESTSTSLRKQLSKLGVQLPKLLGGRQLNELSPSEVFILAKALPIKAKSERQSIYSNVLREQLEQGRLERRSALVKLEELRISLGLSEEDHRSILVVLTAKYPKLQELSAMDLAGLELRQSAVTEEIEDILRLLNQRSLTPDILPEVLNSHLERIRLESGLDEVHWQETIKKFAPDSNRSALELQHLYFTLDQLVSEHWSLFQASAESPLLLPLLLSIDHQIAALLPPLVYLQDLILANSKRGAPSAEQLNALSFVSDNVITFLRSEDDTTLALNNWLADYQRPSLFPQEIITADDILIRLTRDTSDMATQQWAMALRRSETPGHSLLILELMTSVAGRKLMSLLEPKTLLRLEKLGLIRNWMPTNEIDLPLAEVGLILSGGFLKDGQYLVEAANKIEDPMTFLGLLDYLNGPPHSRPREVIKASEHGLQAIVFKRNSFQELLDVSPILEAEITRQLALACRDSKTEKIH